MPDRSRILLVDDDADSNASTREYLEFEGFDVVSAFSGEEAIRAVNVQCPQVVVLDLELPDVRGDELARTLRKTPGMARIPILVLSGRFVGDAARRAEVFAANLQKPVEPQLLCAEIRRHLHQKPSS
jgi:DNA-binding response OmpR family regulator